MNYQEKYIKYKTKYLQLVNKIQKGGDDYEPIEIRIPDGTDQIQPQESSGCGRHALNNLFRNPNNSNQLEALFIKGGKNDKIDLDSARPNNKISLMGICSLIAPKNAKYCLDNENYDTNVLTFALLYAGYEVDVTGYEINNDNLTQENQNKEIIFKKEKTSLAGIVNYGTNHWISIVKNIINNKWYSYDSISLKKEEFHSFEDYFNDKKNKIKQILFIRIPHKVNTNDNLTVIININKQAVVEERLIEQIPVKKQEPKQEFKQESNKQEPKQESKQEPKQESKQEPKQESVEKFNVGDRFQFKGKLAEVLNPVGVIEKIWTFSMENGQEYKVNFDNPKVTRFKKYIFSKYMKKI
jgi:hypothetical protein